MGIGELIGLIVSLIFLIMFSAFFSATETAFTGFSQARMKNLAKTKKRAQKCLDLYAKYDKLLSTLLIGNNIVNIAAASIATIVFTNFYGDIGVTISTIVMTILVLIFGEISPKSIAKEAPESFAMFAVIPLQFFVIIFTPLTFIFDLWKKLLVKIFHLRKKQPSITEEEFKIIVSDIKEEGVLNDVEHDLIQKTLTYDETLVGDVMTKLDKAVLINISENFEKIKSLFVETNYSRIPVYAGNTENIKGILYRADFYETLLNKQTDLTKILKNSETCKENEKISAVLKKLQKNKIHLSMVQNEQGKTVGLVTIDDIIEEMFGEFFDKYDAKA